MGSRAGARLAAGAGLALGLVAATGLAGCGSSGSRTVTADGYRATFPGPATATVKQQEVDGRREPLTVYVAAAGGETDAVAASVLPAVPPAAVQQELIAHVDGSVSGTGGTLISHSAVAWLGHRAEDAEIATTDRLIKERVLIAGDQIYVIEGISRSSRPAFPGYSRLLASFRLVGRG